MNEELLVDYCKDNNATAQKILYHRYVEGMMILCLRYVVNQEEAREVLMDGFYNFFKNMRSFTYAGEGSTKAWLKKIIVNQCLMHLRKQKSFLIISKDSSEYDSKDSAEDPVEYLNAKEIMNMIHALPDGYRTVFNLYVFEGMNHREIAQMLDISEGTSKSQLHRARTMLKEKILQAS